MVCFCFPLVTAWALPFEKWPKRVKRATCEPRAPRLASATFDLVTVSVAFATEGERKRGGVVQEVAAHHALQMGHSKHFLLGMNLQGLLAPPTHLPRHTLYVKTKAFLFLHFNFRLKSKDFAWLRGRFFFCGHVHKFDLGMFQTADATSVGYAHGPTTTAMCCMHILVDERKTVTRAFNRVATKGANCLGITILSACRSS